MHNTASSGFTPVQVGRTGQQQMGRVIRHQVDDADDTGPVEVVNVRTDNATVGRQADVITGGVVLDADDGF